MLDHRSYPLNHYTFQLELASAIIFMKDFIYLFLDRREGEGKERERNISVWLPLTPPNRDLARNPGMCPDWESNQQRFVSQAHAQSTELHQPGLEEFLRGWWVERSGSP